jgi:hypothetical protein
MLMSKQNIVSQAYGYSICLIAVVVFLFNLPDIVELISTLIDPIHSGRAPSIVTQTIEQWDINVKSNSLYDPFLNMRFEREKSDALQSFIHVTWTSLIQKSILVILSILFFIIHWRWVRKIISNIASSADQPAN